MQLINKPASIPLPFASGGAKNVIPTASQIGITVGAASLTDGFPPLTRTPISSGGVGPSGLDMNGVLYEMSAIDRWAYAGGGYPFDSAFANDVNVLGYPKGARVQRSDGLGYWISTTDDNITDPETAGAVVAGWVPDFTYGVSTIPMASANVTLTPLEYGKPIILITGTLTANLNLIFPDIAGQWAVVNTTTGAFSITCKTLAGTGVPTATGETTQVLGDATNILFVSTSVASGITSGTAIATTSGTSHDFTAIPAGTKRITASLSGTGTSSVSIPIIQLGDSGGVEVTGYSGSVSGIKGATPLAILNTNGFNLFEEWQGSQIGGGVVTLVLTDAATNIWSCSGSMGSDATHSATVGGSKSLTGELTTIRLTTTNGTDTFSSGLFNILYE